MKNHSAMMFDPPHPGEVLKDLYIEPLHLTITSAGKGLAISRKTLSAIVNGRAGISSAMALRLSKAFHTSPGLWIGMQAQYDLWQAREGLDLDAVTAFVRE